MKIDVINQNRDYRRIYQRGKCTVTPCVVIYISKNRLNTTRIGITTSKKIGGAVKRNRARRVIREAVRLLKPSMKLGYDLVFVARAKTPYVKSTVILDTLKVQLKSAGIIKQENG